MEPPLGQHLTELESGLATLGFGGVIYMMLSEGGVTTVEAARAFPVRLVESGPAAGATAAAYYGNLMGHKDIVSFDMGGTTAKLCLITHGKPSRTNELEVAREHRFKKGSGLVLRVPSIDIMEIGAGGGSIASIDPMGLMKVGPRSAGADPGPACYGLGGTEPTVTDADLVLGLLNPEYFLGGDMSLDPDAARKAIGDTFAEPMGMSATRAAQGIHEVVNENMATAARMHAAEHGLDIRGHALVAFGGAGPVHAYQVARLLGIKRVVCPLGAGVMSSIGMLVAPRSFDSVQSYISRLDSIDWDHVNSVYEGMESRARAFAIGGGRRTRGHLHGAERRHAVRRTGVRDRRTSPRRQAGTGPSRKTRIHVQRDLPSPVPPEAKGRSRGGDNLAPICLGAGAAA